MRILAAFTDTLGGKDAFALASSLADIFDCALDMVTIVPGGEDRAILDSTDVAFSEVIVTQADDWMEQAIAASAARTVARKHLRYSDSYAQGLLATAAELDSTMLVIGGGRHGALGKVSLGSVGNTLLHSSPIPIALAPRGFRHHPYNRITRVTAMLGTRVDPHSHLLNVAADYSTLGRCPLRLVSLLDRSVPAESAMKEQLSETSHLTAERTGTPVSFVVQPGDNTEDAMSALDWKRHEIALVGSSRMAQKGRLFLGSTANKILRSTPVPMIVIPMGSGSAGETGGTQ